MKEMEPHAFEREMGSVLADMHVGNARALAALLDAVAQQPGIDRDKLLKDFFTFLPTPEQAGKLGGSLYQSIDDLLASNHEVLPRKRDD